VFGVLVRVEVVVNVDGDSHTANVSYVRWCPRISKWETPYVAQNGRCGELHFLHVVVVIDCTEYSVAVIVLRTEVIHVLQPQKQRHPDLQFIPLGGYHTNSVLL